MDSSRQILRALTLCLLTLWLCACQSTTFADHFSISEITGAASMDIPPKGQIPVDGDAVLAIVRQAVPDGSAFTPTTVLSIFDDSGSSYLLFFSQDRRYFAVDGTGWRLTRRQASAVNKLI